MDHNENKQTNQSHIVCAADVSTSRGQQGNYSNLSLYFWHHAGVIVWKVNDKLWVQRRKQATLHEHHEYPMQFLNLSILLQLLCDHSTLQSEEETDNLDDIIHEDIITHTKYLSKIRQATCIGAIFTQPFHCSRMSIIRSLQTI